MSAYEQVLELVAALTHDQRVGVLRALHEGVSADRNINRCIDRWCDKRGTTREIMRAAGRARSVSHMRQRLFAWLTSQRYSSAEIGIALNRDHSTVLEGVRAHRARAAKYAR